MDDATSAQITVTLPGNLMAQVDAQVGSNFVDRDEFIRAAVRHYIEYIQMSTANPSQNIG